MPRGAIAALGFNYGDVGRQTGKIVVRVLKGEKPGDIPVEGVEITELFVNPGGGRGDGRDAARGGGGAREDRGEVRRAAPREPASPSWGRSSSG